MIYFTSDLHLGHDNVIRFNDRPFKSIEEMNQKLIDNINSFVHKDDTLYLLGDISFKIEKGEAEDLIKKIKGKKVFIKGNHDKNYDPSLFEGVYDYLEIVHKGIKFDLMHYPLASWRSMRRGAIQLHGHIHATEKYNLKNRTEGKYQYDVGVDANNYYPVSIEQIIDFFKDVPLIYDDSHLTKYD